MKYKKYLKILLACLLITSIFGFVWHCELIQSTQIENLKNLQLYAHYNGLDLSIWRNSIYENGTFTNGFMNFTVIQTYHMWLWAEIILGLITVVVLIKDGGN